MPTPLDQAWPSFSLGPAISPEGFHDPTDPAYVAPTYSGEMRVSATFNFAHPTVAGPTVATVTSYSQYVARDDGGTLRWVFWRGYQVFPQGQAASAFEPPPGLGALGYRSDYASLYEGSLDPSGSLYWRYV
jgi:hypothetical protein